MSFPPVRFGELTWIGHCQPYIQSTIVLGLTMISIILHGIPTHIACSILIVWTTTMKLLGSVRLFFFCCRLHGTPTARTVIDKVSYCDKTPVSYPFQVIESNEKGELKSTTLIWKNNNDKTRPAGHYPITRVNQVTAYFSW